MQPLTLWYPDKPGMPTPWWRAYYDKSDSKLLDRCLFAQLPLPADLKATKTPIGVLWRSGRCGNERRGRSARKPAQKNAKPAKKTEKRTKKKTEKKAKRKTAAKTSAGTRSKRTANKKTGGKAVKERQR